MEVEVSELYYILSNKIWFMLISYVVFMSTLLAFFTKNLFILFFDELETDSSENIDSFSGGLCMSSPRSSWFTVDKQGILTLFFYVVKPV